MWSLDSWNEIKRLSIAQTSSLLDAFKRFTGLPLIYDRSHIKIASFPNISSVVKWWTPLCYQRNGFLQGMILSTQLTFLLKMTPRRGIHLSPWGQVGISVPNLYSLSVEQHTSFKRKWNAWFHTVKHKAHRHLASFWKTGDAYSEAHLLLNLNTKLFLWDETHKPLNYSESFP